MTLIVNNQEDIKNDYIFQENFNPLRAITPAHSGEGAVEISLIDSIDTLVNGSYFPRSLREPGTIGRGECIRTSAASAGRARRRSAPSVRRRGAIEAPLWSFDLGRGLDGQPSQSPEGQEVAQDGGHQGSEGLPHHFGGSRSPGSPRSNCKH